MLEPFDKVQGLSPRDYLAEAQWVIFFSSLDAFNILQITSYSNFPSVFLTAPHHSLSLFCIYFAK